MSTSHVVRLDDYRSRRNDRLQCALALSGWRRADRSKTALLARALEVAGADRAVSFWVDEYQSGAIHIDRVVDLASNPPRRGVSGDLLERAYDHGFPGLIDAPEPNRAGALLFPEVPSSSLLLSVGSDGAHSWFVLVDGLTPRSRLDARQREELMFLAGELSTLVLQEEHVRWQGVSGSFERSRAEAFAGWGVLGDLAEGTLADAERPKVNVRFLTARLVKMYLDEGLYLDRTGLADQTRQIRTELEDLDDFVDEGALIHDVIARLEADDVGGLARALLALATHNDQARRLHAARDLYLSVYELAVHAAEPEVAMDAAWSMGRASRRATDWTGAFRWYQWAAELAKAFQDHGRYGRILDGLANAHRDRGSLPKAREILAQALKVATEHRDSELRASAFHTLMTVEKLAGAHGRAIVYGWESVQAHTDGQRRLWALMDLGSVFMEAGQYDDAEEALDVVVRDVEDLDARVLAISTLSQSASSRGNRKAFEQRCLELEAAGWQSASAIIRGQIMLDRGLSWMRLGEPQRAKEALEWALAFGEGQQVSKVVLDADDALRKLGDGSLVVQAISAEDAEKTSRDCRVAEVSRGLRELSAETTALAGV